MSTRNSRWLARFAICGIAAFGCGNLSAGEASTGDYTEVHACEVYTGGCTASAQATQGGRSVLRVWKFDAVAGSLSGLTVAVLEVADANLAMRGTEARAAVAYLPEQATEAQRDELLDWLKQNGVQVTDSRVKPVRYARDGERISFSAGKEIAFSTRGIEACDAGSCGEQLWYEPRGKTGAYTVLVNERSVVEEPGFKLTWKDNSAKSVFFGRFGGSEQAVFHQASLH